MASTRLLTLAGRRRVGKPRLAWQVADAVLDRSRREQPGRDAHAAFMDAPTDTGAVLFGGPTGVGTDVLLVVTAVAERETVHRILAPDP